MAAWEQMMKRRKRCGRRRFERPLRDETARDEAVNQVCGAGVSTRAAKNRNALQLCRQVGQALSLALAACSDPVLLDLLVVEVRPCPDSSRLLVLVQSSTTSPCDPACVREHLANAAGKLRSDAATAIHRRRAPELVFHLCAR